MKKLIPWLIAGLFIMPLIFLNGYIFPFIVPKILFFRSLTLVTLGCYLLLLISDVQRYRPKFSFVTIGIGLFWLSLLISTFAGADWYRSFWDNHERMLGLFTMTHYTLVYLIASSVFESDREWTTVFRSALILGSLVMFIGVWQKFVNPEALMNGGSWRVSATLGNAIYYSGYGLFLMFLGVLQYFRESTNTWKYTSLALAVLGFFGIFFGGTRGTMIGLVAGIGTVAVLYAFFAREKTRVTRALKYTTIVGVVILGALILFRHTPFVSQLPGGIGRLFSTSFSLSNPTETRPMAWKVAIDSWKEKPLFGWGPNNYYYAFNQYYNPQFLNFGWGETWFDNAHSVIFNTLTVQGLFGILVYLGIYGAAITLLVIGVRRGQVSQHVGFISIGFLVAHLISLVTVFENPTSYLYFFVFLAFVAWTVRGVRIKKPTETVIEDKKNKKIVAVTRRSPIGLLILVWVCIVSIIYTTNILPARANKATARTLQELYAGVATKKSVQDTVNMPTPHIDDVRNDIIRTIMSVMQSYAQAGKLQELNGLFEIAVQELQRNQLLHPLDIRVHFTLSQLLSIGYGSTQNMALLLQSEAELKRSLVLSPRRQQFEYALAENLVEQKKFDEAIDLMKGSIEHNEKITEGWVRLATIYAAAGQSDKAHETAQYILDHKEMKLESNWQAVLDAILKS